MKYETHAYGIKFEMENVFRKWNEKNRNLFWELKATHFLEWNEKQDVNYFCILFFVSL